MPSERGAASRSSIVSSGGESLAPTILTSRRVVVAVPDKENIDLLCEAPTASKVRRNSISSEVYGKFGSETPDAFKAVEKSKEVRRFLLSVLMNLASPLKEWVEEFDDRDFNLVIDAARPCHAEAGEKISVQGQPLTEASPGFYVLESGSIDVARKCPKDAQADVGHEPHSRKGECFGVMSLLYGAPHAATITATRKCRLWSINHNTMALLKRRCTEEKRERSLKHLGSVKLFEPLDLEARMRVVDNLSTVRFTAGEVMIQQGQESEKFFMLEQGEASCCKDGEVFEQYTEGRCFGELALFDTQNRNVSVVADTDCTCAVMDRETFNRLLGPLEDICEDAKALSPSKRAARQSRRADVHVTSESSRSTIKMTLEAKPRNPQEEEDHEEPAATNACDLSSTAKSSGSWQPPDYRMSRVDRLTYDSDDEEALSESWQGSRTWSPDSQGSHSPPKRSRFSKSAAAVKALMRQGSKSSQKEGVPQAPYLYRDDSAPCSV